MTDLAQIPNIVNTIIRCYDIGPESLQKLAAKLTRVEFAKRHMLVREGVCEGQAYFIEKGMLRCFWLVDGNEITTSFASEGGMVFSMDELYYGRRSEEYVQAIEPIVAYAIPLTELVGLFESDLRLANWARVIHQNEYRRLHRSHKERLTLPARERYEAFASQFPDVCRRARLTDIASYLGVSTSTLSRIRRRK
ncbi:MAG: Crp/Fnr family transcriptional regulator [Bacteroides sp.]|nr:Crp/Fnr family transcriptional regulator [Bacteroidales bacterium]MBD5315137.1 Crp/Fnr family transcriptional regulator [Bacteroides sp.]